MKRILLFVFSLIPFALMSQPGTLDKSFGDNGISLDANIVGVINKVGLQSDGKIIAAGSGGKDVPSTFLFERYNTDGSIDSSFGVNGHAGSINEMSQVFAISIQSDDGFIAMGHPSYKVGLARYKKDGELDSSFGVNGVVITSVSSHANSASDMMVQPDGKIVVCGYIINDPNEARQLFLIRYLPNGSLDNSFGDGGVVIVGQPDGDKSLATVNALALLSNGQIVVSLTNAKSTVYRFNPDGSQDKIFGNNGSAFFQSKDDAVNGLNATGLIVQPDGKIIGCGSALIKKNSSDEYMAAARINADGSIDSSFGNNGIQHIIFGQDYSKGTAILLQKDGKIVLSGWSHDDFTTYANFALTRLNTDGNIDSSFGENGKTVTTISTYTTSTSSVLQNDGKIILGGTAGSNFALARYNNDLTKKQIIFAKIRRWWQHHNGIMWDNVPGIKNYAIQRSGDGAHWSTVYSASINHSPLTSNNSQLTINNSPLSIHNYYNDATPLSGDNYYRLQTTSVTGAVNYSNVIAINNTSIKISPNPAKN
ncbi:MAG: hypothetical protein JST21_13780, partial [Bacteroidetes bacterium]|nr:hypothetical protein [Bacteroidota bacterium]